MIPDPAHVQTDELIAQMEREISREYALAHKEVSEKLKDYLRRFEKKDKIWRKWVEEGTKTKAEYLKWRKGQILMGKRWAEMRDTLAEDYVNAAKIAQSVVNGYIPEVYALNHNYATFEIEKGSRIDTSYTLYSHEAVERLLRGDKFYHGPGAQILADIASGKLKAWDKQRIQSVMLQGILQGESIPALTRRLERVTGGSHAAAIRNARTMTTGVQNAGRMDAMKRANDMGIQTEKQWIATLDSRTRHWHRELDGVSKPIDKPFENDFGKIMYPGDPTAHGANVYNCRCTMISRIKGYEIDTKKGRTSYNDQFAKMTYDEWLKEKKSHSLPITYEEDMAEHYKNSYLRQYMRR